jgi:menaquinone-dependent protoporphyrinogen oxidase
MTNARRVLVAVASRYGSTREIAQAIAEVLSARGLDVTLSDAEQATQLDAYDAFVLGSGVYAGHWLRPAQELIEKNRELLASLPVWLFSSGPVGEPPLPKEHPVDVRALEEAVSPRGHEVFAGRVDRKRLNFAEKAIVIALRVPDGDFRDWQAIRRWAEDVAAELQS